ncbi:DUF1835 domain-containing protein [Pseudomonas sp. GD04087]|uniref:DUF1835 domain-containing protein n=1 Tax=unclassified Pseudomonas TaxID=196821 RepID=UPI00244A0803|nr:MULTISPECIES: DUF1835 domain-containing protein [unclassified Pseudomonas]MDH0289196.1 DUF1835 domain-containing protein [Pseudomonas sp. GD04087]MDH1047953.1 DUF1835 domain-containing protein [Pseudomonas sp. GD03903]MDH1998636.1 DUF1835 domain-containing protein [Pseudomonas sp. GD03691]
MSLHLVCGDGAADALRRAVEAGVLTEKKIRVMPDDLAVGPLSDVDNPPCQQRAAFWHELGGDALREREIAVELATDANWLRSPDARSVTLWHGDSASEQLLLRRVCALLPAQVTLRSVGAGSGQCRSEDRHAIAMLKPEELANALAASHELDAAERQRLGADWQHALTENTELRLWLDGRLSGTGYAHIDRILLDSASEAWRPVQSLIGPTMAYVDGLFVSDLLAVWRLRAQVAAGTLELRGDDFWSNGEVRLA